MTDAPSLPAQMDKVRWHIEYWKSRNLNDHAQEMCDVLVTLQQHERLVAEIAQMEAGYKNAAELVLTYHGKNERLEAALRLIAAFEGKALMMASDDPHERQAYSLGAHRAFAQASGIAADTLAPLDTAAPETPMEGGE